MSARSYRSSRREEQARRTRRRVIEAATSVFVAQGYAGTTMRAVAAAAGVSVPTVELLFGTKARLLKAAIDVAIAGDDEASPVLERDWTVAALNAGSAEDFLDVVAGVLGPAQARSAGLILAVFEGTAADPGLGGIAEQMIAQREITAGWVVDRLSAKAALRASLGRQDAIDTVWILMDPALFDRLVRRRGWTVERYQDWFARSAHWLLIDDTPRIRPPPKENDVNQHPRSGSIACLQLPATDVARSAAFYQAAFGWSADGEHGDFEASGVIGQWTTDLAPAPDAGPVVWIWVDQLYPALQRVEAAGGRVRGRPRPDDGERWLAEIDDPAGNRIGVVAPARTAQAQTLLGVRDVEASSRWYQQLLGLRSDHGGPEYERLLADDVLVLQLHHRHVEHHHGLFTDDGSDVGNGVLVWFGEVTDFDGVLQRAADLGATVVRPPHRNPPQGQGNGPGHREVWLQDPDGYTIVIASTDGEAYEV